jgi:sugar (pentulose or hexulose) kinase
MNAQLISKHPTIGDLLVFLNREMEPLWRALGWSDARIKAEIKRARQVPEKNSGIAIV